MGNLNPGLCHQEDESIATQEHDETEYRKLSSYRQIHLIPYLKTIPSEDKTGLKESIQDLNLVFLDHVI